MRTTHLIALAATALLVGSVAAQAQEKRQGARGDPAEERAAEGLIGSIIAEPVNASTGTIAGIFGDDEPLHIQPFARAPSRRCDEGMRLGNVLRRSGMASRRLSADSHKRGSRRRVRNDAAIVVDPQTGCVIDVID
jgi:hypothetical protein